VQLKAILLIPILVWFMMDVFRLRHSWIPTEHLFPGIISECLQEQLLPGKLPSRIGDNMFKDVNKDGKITFPEDAVALGSSDPN